MDPEPNLVAETYTYVSLALERASWQGRTVMAGKGSSGGKRGRSAITGKFVKQSTVKRNPKETVNERTGKGKGKR